MADGRKLLDYPSLDWALIVTLGVATSVSPLVAWFESADLDAQRQTMASACQALGVIAAFNTAALFFYAGLDNPATRGVRARWSGRLARTFVRALSAIVVATLVCAFTGLGSPNTAATITFFLAIVAAVVKLGRIVLVVLALLHGQDHDVRELPDLQIGEPVDGVRRRAR